MSKAACLLLVAGLACAQSTTLTINTGMAPHSIDRRIYGLGIDNTVWGEEVRNRSFEDAATEGDWLIKAGVLESSSGQFHIGDDSWRDYDLSLDVARSQGATVTLAIRAGAGHNIAVALGAPAGTEFSQTTHNSRRVLQTFSSGLASGGVHHLRIRAENKRVQVWLDDRSFESSDPDPAPGRLILGVIGGVSSFSHIMVRALDGTPLFTGVPSRARDWNVLGNADAAPTTEYATSGMLSLRITAPAAEAGIEQQNLSVRSGDTLRGALSLAGAGVSVIVRLVDGTRVLAEQTVTAPTAKLTEIPIVLTSAATSSHAALRILARARSAFTIDHLTLMADSARANGGIRLDISQAAARLHTNIVRWDAGDWKAAIGQQAQRAEPFGIDEFLAFARAIHADPIVATTAGPAAIELIDYCNGTSATPWGAARARNGHAQPFNLRYLELSEGKPPALEQTAAAIKAAVPAIRLIGAVSDPSLALRSAARLLDFVAAPAGAGESERNALASDAADSRSPKMKLAISAWRPQAPLHAALTLNALERSPAFALATMQWNAPSPIDAVFKLYSEAGAPDVLQITGTPRDLDAVATRTEDGNRIVIKLVNPTNSEIATDLVLRGDFPLLNASLKVLSAGAIQPIDGKVERKGMAVHVAVPAASVAFVTLSR